MSSTIYVVDRKKKYQRDWNDEEHFKWEQMANETVERKNLADAIRMSQKLRTLKYARPSSSGYDEAQELIERMSKGVWEVRKIRVNDRYS